MLRAGFFVYFCYLDSYFLLYSSVLPLAMKQVCLKDTETENWMFLGARDKTKD